MWIRPFVPKVCNLIASGIMGDWNKSQPSASTDLLPYALPLDRNVNLSRFIETFTSSNHEVLHDVQEVEKSRRQLCERIEMEIPPSDVGKISVMNNSLAVLSAQQMQLVDLMRSMSEQLRLIQSMSVQIQQADNPYPRSVHGLVDFIIFSLMYWHKVIRRMVNPADLWHCSSVVIGKINLGKLQDHPKTL